MEKQNNFWASNIKCLRARRKLSQETLAGLLGMTRAKVNAHENGHTQNPSLDDLLVFSGFFRLSIDHLIRKDLSRLSEHEFRSLWDSEVYITGDRLRVLAITVDGQDNENVEYVPIKAKAGYAAGHSDPEYIAALPRYNLPNIPAQGTYRIFPISGDSMLPIPDGSDVVAAYVQDWGSLRAGTPCIVVLKGEQDFVFKKVDLRPEGLLLSSLNALYPPYFVPMEEVMEIWRFHSYTSPVMPEGPTDLDALIGTVQELKKGMDRIEAQVSQHAVTDMRTK